MRSNRLLAGLMVLALGGGGLSLWLIYGGFGDDLDTACAAAAIWELSPEGSREERLGGALAEIATLELGGSARALFSAVAKAPPGDRYALLLSEAHHDGLASFQCPALRRLANPHPAGSAAHDWQLLCDLTLELRALPGLPPLEREERLLRRYRMEGQNEAVSEALEQAPGDRTKALENAVREETGAPPSDCGLAALWSAAP